jgi:predicted HAD superfamily hydrolase
VSVSTPIAGYSALPGVIARAARGTRVVGFDVFDTLLRRRIEPESVKDLAARHLARLAAGGSGLTPLDAPGVPDWKLLREKRRLLEIDLGHHAEKNGDDHEFRLREMTMLWVDQCLTAEQRAEGEVGEGISRAVVAYELECEKAATLRAPAIGAVLEAAAGEGRRLIFVSDSYKSEDDVRSLLAHHGLSGHFARGYVSSSILRTKRSGRLFEHVLKEEGIQPAEMLFVGDNPYSDIESPAKHGIRTVRVRDRFEARRRARLRMLDDASRRNSYWRGDLCREIVETAAPPSERDSDCDHYRLGLLLAPGFVAFTRFLLEQSREKGLRRMFFLSREGYTFQRMYRRMARAMGLKDAPPAEYVVASRASTFLASIDRLDADEINRIWWQYNRQSLIQLLRNLGLPLETFVPLARKCGFEELVQPIPDLRTHEPLQNFIASPAVQREFTIHRDRARELLAEYLRSKGWFGAGGSAGDGGSDRIGLVDIGWKGSIQNNLFRAVRGMPGAPAIEGFYFGLARTHHDEHPRNAKLGFMADTATGDWTQECIFKNGPVFEMFSTAMHSSPEAYEVVERATGPRVRPVLKREESEEKNFSTHFASVRRGIRDYFDQVIRVMPLLDFSSAELRPHVLHQLRRYILYPTAAEARAFLAYSHVENFGVFKVSDYHFKGSWRTILAGGSPTGIPRRLLHELRQQLWPEAICRRSPLPLANLGFDLIETRRGMKYVP